MIIDELTAILGFKVEGEDRLKRFNKGLEDISASAGRMAQSVGNAATLIGGALTVGFGLLGRSVINTGATFEGLRTQLTSLEGSAEKAEESLAWIKKFGQETPLSLTEAARAFAMMRNFGLDPTNGSLQAIVDNAALMNKGIDSVMGIILPLGQAWSAQKLQGQDMMQLVNQGIPAWGLLAEALGKTVAEVREMSEKGKIGRAEMKLFFDALAKRGAGASARMAKTWTGVMARMGDAWEDFNLRISEAGIFESAKSRAEELLAVFQRWQKDGTMDRVAKKVSNAMESISKSVMVVIERMAHHIKYLNDNWDELGVYINAAGVAMALLVAKANPVITAFLILGLVIEDFITYLQGGESVFGSFVEWLQKTLGISKTLAEHLTGMGAVVSAALLAAAPTIFGALIKGAIRFLTGPVGLALVVAEIAGALLGYDFFDTGVKLMNMVIDGMKSMIPNIPSLLSEAFSGIFNPESQDAIQGKVEAQKPFAKSMEKTLEELFGPVDTWLWGLGARHTNNGLSNLQGNMERVGANGAAAAIPSTINDNSDQSRTVNVAVGGVTINNAQNAGPAVGAAVGQAIANASAEAAITPARILINKGAF